MKKLFKLDEIMKNLWQREEGVLLFEGLLVKKKIKNDDFLCLAPVVGATKIRRKKTPCSRAWVFFSVVFVLYHQ